MKGERGELKGCRTGRVRGEGRRSRMFDGMLMVEGRVG